MYPAFPNETRVKKGDYLDRIVDYIATTQFYLTLFNTKE